jgi:hypothetical protein
MIMVTPCVLKAVLLSLNAILVVVSGTCAMQTSIFIDRKNLKMKAGQANARELTGAKVR